jgi:hypothetical protein
MSNTTQRNEVNTIQQLLPVNVLRLLSDKFYDKRKQAALEVEKYVLFLALCAAELNILLIPKEYL